MKSKGQVKAVHHKGTQQQKKKEKKKTKDSDDYIDYSTDYATKNRTEYAETGEDLKELALLIRRAKTILDTERLARKMSEVSSKRQQKKIEKIINKRQAKLTEAYDRKEILKEERVRANKEKKEEKENKKKPQP